MGLFILWGLGKKKGGIAAALYSSKNWRKSGLRFAHLRLADSGFGSDFHQAGIQALGGDIAVNELDDRHRGVVAETEAGLETRV